MDRMTVMSPRGKMKKEEYAKCPICGERVDLKDFIIQSLTIFRDGEEWSKIFGEFHEKCNERFQDALDNGAVAEYDATSHRILIHTQEDKNDKE